MSKRSRELGIIIIVGTAVWFAAGFAFGIVVGLAMAPR